MKNLLIIVIMAIVLFLSMPAASRPLWGYEVEQIIEDKTGIVPVAHITALESCILLKDSGLDTVLMPNNISDLIPLYLKEELPDICRNATIPVNLKAGGVEQRCVLRQLRGGMIPVGSNDKIKYERVVVAGNYTVDLDPLTCDLL